MLLEIAGQLGYQLYLFAAGFFRFAFRQSFRRRLRNGSFQRFQTPLGIANAVCCRIACDDLRISINRFLFILRDQLFFLRVRDFLLPQAGSFFFIDIAQLKQRFIRR